MMKKKVAEDICSMVDDILNQMQAFNNYVVVNCERSQLERIVPALARCVTTLDLEILDPVYREYPEFKPTFLP
jgi:hypothetical protein